MCMHGSDHSKYCIQGLLLVGVSMSGETGVKRQCYVEYTRLLWIINFDYLIIVFKIRRFSLPYVRFPVPYGSARTPSADIV